MAARRTPARPPAGGTTPLWELVVRVALVVVMWVVLRAVGAARSEFVILATLAAIFGPSFVGSLLDRFRE